MDDQHVGQAPQVQLLVRLVRGRAGRRKGREEAVSGGSVRGGHTCDGQCATVAEGASGSFGAAPHPLAAPQWCQTAQAPSQPHTPHLHVLLALGAVPAVVGVQLLRLQERLRDVRKGWEKGVGERVGGWVDPQSAAERGWANRHPAAAVPSAWALCEVPSLPRQ